MVDCVGNSSLFPRWTTLFFQGFLLALGPTLHPKLPSLHDCTDVMALDQGADEDDEDNDGGGKYARLQEEARAKRVAEGEDAEHPDEMEVPLGVSARVRFQKYKCVLLQCGCMLMACAHGS
eukprot:1159547-Pelagomonas_calceolata.AAC.25